MSTRPLVRTDERHSLDGDWACRGCGYGVAAGRLPAACPMCRGTSWLPLPERRRESEASRERPLSQRG